MKSTASWTLPCIVLATIAVICTQLKVTNAPSDDAASKTPDAPTHLVPLTPPLIPAGTALSSVDLPPEQLNGETPLVRTVAHFSPLYPLQEGRETETEEPSESPEQQDTVDEQQDTQSSQTAQALGQQSTTNQQVPGNSQAAGQISRASLPASQLLNFQNITLEYKDIQGADRRIAIPSNDPLRLRPRDAVTITGQLPGGRTDEDLVILEIDGTRRETSVAQDTFAFTIPAISQGPHTVRISAVERASAAIVAEPVRFQMSVRTAPVRVIGVDTGSLAFSSHPYPIRVTFDTSELDLRNAQFKLLTIADNGTTSAFMSFSSPRLIDHSASVELVIDRALPAGLYSLSITGVTDHYGNTLLGNDTNSIIYTEQILKPVGGEIASVRPGITGPTGPYVPYAEFTEPRNVPDGFNPHDKVEARVARLYFYRDAHRVTQIINRKVRSYNRAGVDMQRQLADHARTEADKRTDARQAAERNAIILAQRTREKEQELQAAEQSLSRSIQELSMYRPPQNTNEVPPPPTPSSDPTLQQLEGLVRSLGNRADDLRTQVAALRDQEIVANEEALRMEASERRAREDQFRREVAAAHADPDTYAPGVPHSDDPVEQVSVSVIGEGLIHLRGPLKGINTVRTMIDQIDQPVGQVRVA